MSVIQNEVRTEQIPARLHRLGPGWHALAVRVHQEMCRRDPAYQLLELAEHRGGIQLRVASAVDMRQVAMQARRASQHVCEICGEPGQARVRNRRNPRIVTRCPLCATLTRAPDGHRAWRIVDGNDAPLPAGRGGYAVVVGDQDQALRVFGRLLRLSGWVPVEAAGSTVTVDRHGVREVWTVEPVSGD